jgi:hypothetical protein
MDVIVGVVKGKEQPVIVVPKHGITLGINRTAKAAVVYNYLEDDVPVSRLGKVQELDVSLDTISSLLEAVENIEQLEDEADSYSDIGWKDVDKYLMGGLDEGSEKTRIESYMGIENRLLEARNALNTLCHRFFDQKLIRLGVIEEKEERPEESCSNC